MADKKRSPELIALAVELYGELKSTQKVARRLELGVSTTHRLLKAAGVVMPGRHAAEIQERKKSLHGERAEQVAVDYAAGMPLAEIRRKYEVGTWAIRTAVKDYGGTFRPKGAQVRRFSDNEKAEISRLYRDGWSQGQIAVKFNSSQPMIGRLLARLGVASGGDKARGSQHGSWKGGRVKVGSYVAVMVDRSDPMYVMTHHNGDVLEHRLVMARALGRPLLEHETVHHLDGNRENNDLSNLQLRFGKHGKGSVLKCRCCGSNDIEAVEL